MHEMEELVAANLDLNAEDIAEALLSESGTKGNLPTDEKRILEYLGLKMEAYDIIGEMAYIPTTKKRDIRAVISFGDKTIAVQRGLMKSPPRLKFSVFHEVGHFVLPEHVDKFYLCSGDDLGYRTRSALEAEANRFAADMIFQVGLLAKESNDQPLRCGTITDLAQKYGASFEATGRRYVEQNEQACALVVYKKLEESLDELEFDGLPSFRPEYTVTSRAFMDAFFTKIIEEKGDPSKSAVLKAFKTMDAFNTVQSKMSIDIIGKGKVEFDSELFTNGYKVFRLIWP